ncbi:hypothetical protein KZZ52_04595 [Dactylosporangium sp. AC04546]|uniref:hypothetical protein n=1 Tax=Dactylosporangium sp. AC04546 TaxID=2862460 RepID=UPI002E7C0949|nr:hypothetical protein [Dactylosporangium sp. AC04546]WVK84698.1 hypothetical protein KZZ52_04595 [Dactylosporangium sp. AC04546]
MAEPELGDAPVARIQAPAPRPDDFPLWPTTTTVAVAVPDDPTVEAAHLAGAVAVRDHLAGRPEQWPTPAMRVMRPPRVAPGRSKRPPKRLRHPATGLASMLLLALLTGFFAWTSAEPFWLDMGHEVRGTATVTACADTGVLRRCQATFRNETTERSGVALLGEKQAPGASVSARMVPDGRIAYAGAPSGLRVRWTVGLGLVLLCGLMLSWLTGAWRLGRLRTRLGAWALTTAAPLVLAVGIVMASY